MRWYVYIPIFLLLACSNQKSMSPAASNHFDKQGHRGCRGLMPENTVPAMLKALELGVTTLEMDVVVTKDKKIILSHEQWFGREITTKPDGTFMGDREERRFNIYWMTYEQTREFDVGLKEHPRFPRQQKIKVTKPLLTDVIDSVNQFMVTAKRPPVWYNIETKSQPMFDGVFQPAPAEFIELLMGVVNEKGIRDRVIIQSFDFRTLQYLRQKYPDVKTAMLIEDFDKRTLAEQLENLGFVPEIYSPAFTLVNEELIKACHRKNMKIIPWTVNEKSTIDRLKKMGVDGIITDYPDLFNEE